MTTSTGAPPTTPRECAIADALELIGDRWTLLVIRELFYGQRRFSEIARNTAAPRDILTARLRKLEQAGLVHRTEYSAHPPRFDYRLTASGRALSPVLMTLKQWGEQHVPAKRRTVEWVHDCGELFSPDVHCAACGKTLDPADLHLPDRS